MKYAARSIILSLLFLLVGFSVVKVFTEPYFAGRLNKETFLLVIFVLLLALIILRCFEKKFHRDSLIILLFPIIILLTGKTAGLAGLAVYLIASFAVGLAFYSYMSSRARNERGDPVGITVVSRDCFSLDPPAGGLGIAMTLLKQALRYFISLFLGLGINSYLIWLLMHFRVNYLYTYYLLFLFEIWLFRARLVDGYLKYRQKFVSYRLSPGQKILILAGAVHLFYALVSNYLWDDMIAHLYIPKVVSLYNIFDFNPQYASSFFNEPLLMIGSHTGLFLLGGEYAIRLFHLFLFYASFFLLESCVRRIFDRRIAFFTSLAAVSTPYILWQISNLYIDGIGLFASTILFLYFLYLLKQLNRRNLILYFLLLPFVIMSKQQGIFLIIPTLLILLFTVIFFKRKLFGDLIKYSPLSLLVILPLFLHNTYITGNPVFPMYNDIFQSPHFETKVPIPGFFKFTGVGLNWNSLYDITFAGDKYVVTGNNSFLFGLSYFIILPFFPLILLYRQKRLLIFLTFIFFLSTVFLCFLITGPQMRYFIISLPMGSLLLGLIINKILEVTGGGLAHLMAILLIACVFIINFVIQINNSHLPAGYPAIEAFTGKIIDSSFYNRAVKQFFTYVNGKYSKEAKGFMFYSPALYLADFHIEVYDWYNFPIARKLNMAKSGKEAYAILFKEEKFDFLIFTDNHPRTVLDAIVEEGMVKKDYSSGGYNLYLPTH